MRRTIGVLTVVLACAAGGATLAQTARQSSGGNAQALRQLQQLASERTALQAENERLKQELATLKGAGSGSAKEQAALRARASGAEARATRAGADAAAAQQALQTQKAKLDELVGRFREVATQLRTAETERAQAREQASARGRDLDACVVKNVELAGIVDDVLSRYENAGFGHAVARAEPFTRLTRTRVENLVDEYRSRAQELRAEPRPVAR